MSVGVIPPHKHCGYGSYPLHRNDIYAPERDEVWLTFRWTQSFLVFRTPSKRMDICRSNVAPEIVRRVIVGAQWSQLQQLSAGNNNRSHPVRTWWTSISHFDHHTFDKAALKTVFDLVTREAFLAYDKQDTVI